MNDHQICHLTLAKACLASYLDDEAFYEIGFDNVYTICNSGTRCVAYLALKHDTKDAVLVYRGTGDMNDLKTNFSVKQVVYDGYWRVHEGWIERHESLYTSVRELVGNLGSMYKLSVTGHSMGGVLACLYAIESGSNPSVVTFGSPKVGGKNFAKRIDELNITRYVNQWDFVTMIPLCNYYHGGDSVKLTNNLDKFSIFQTIFTFLVHPFHAHRMRTYLGRLYSSKLDQRKS